MTTKESLLQIQSDLLTMSAMVEEQIGRIDRIMLESGAKPEGITDVLGELEE
ncbi:hypothetical protein FHS18_000569 [Paenibacillus phyllosphaerae]|uniref:Uncharacterized protein n=1 Tax=Paenibacillus phyllosphaerae TaxID=274593 RepID=A0A7W5AUJ9_9BACL|nr:hypothetical protein [Paenibacillus phyllosphaerae]MBB3108541.1 hypothetical protein [Paenibacillus phyllosphaerae]